VQVRLNFPNGDMVGHTGDFGATVSACETIDACVGVRLRAWCFLLEIDRAPRG
jgi:bisphosphoglycerate-independent phosphoglycerate mutase (AlkP superfamily)